MEKLTLIIPAKNEAESLPKVLLELKNYGFKIIIILEETDKDTIKAIKNFECKIVYQAGKGYGNALIEGIKNVETDYLCIFNADGSFDPKYLKQMLKVSENNTDFVFASRYMEGAGSDDDTFLTFIGNKFFTTLCKILFKLNVSDVLFTYVMGKSDAFKKLDLQSKDFTFCIELPVKAKMHGFRCISSPSYERLRISGKKKVNEFKDGFLILISIIKLFIKKI